MLSCKSVNECIAEINAYIQHPSGHPLLVGIDGIEDYRQILNFIEADNKKILFRTSDYCTDSNLSNPVFLWGKVKKTASQPIVWIGATQAAMLVNAKQTYSFLLQAVDQTVGGSVIVLCPYCCGHLNAIAAKYEKQSKRIIVLPNEQHVLPTLELYATVSLVAPHNYINGTQKLLRVLEDGKASERIPFVYNSDITLFQESSFPIVTGATTYERLKKAVPEIAIYTQEGNGSEEQWRSMMKLCEASKSFADLCESYLGDLDKLSISFVDHIVAADENTQFVCFIAMKVYLSVGQGYIQKCIRSTTTVDTVVENLYLALAKESPSDPHFLSWKKERRRILSSLDDNVSLMQDYCDSVTIHGRDVLCFLSDDTESERAAIIHALCTYHYSEKELDRILPDVSPSLHAYLRTFHFDQLNTKVLDSADNVHSFLTKYFQAYKYQKISNQLDKDFLAVVEEEATRRTFTKLPARSMLLKKMDKSSVTPYFFDALGVEFLGFIEEKCKEYGIQIDIQIAHCNLPSITSKNKEFFDVFPPDTILKEEGLDDLKHHGTKHNFLLTPEPVYLFDELFLLAKRLREFATLLAGNKMSKIVLLTDHGASRLAVTYQSVNDKLTLEEKGKHSGRCCPASEDPHIDFVTYEDGYAVLANYERFSGSRKAAVEAHGGASLEEMLVPIITLTATPKQQQAFFKDDVVRCSPKDGTSIDLFVNPVLAAPRIVVSGSSYTGEFVGDKHNVTFKMPDIKRKGHYEAVLYDGNTQIATLAFEAIRKTSAFDNFGF